MKKLSFLAALFIGLSAFAQNQTVTVAGIVRTYTGVISTTIQEVKSISGEDAACRDLSYFINTTVQFAGRAVMSGLITYPAATIDGIVYQAITTTPGVFPSNGSAQVNVLRAGYGDYSTIFIRPSDNIIGNSMRDVWVENDSIVVQGRVENRRGQTQFNMTAFTIVSGVNTTSGSNPIDAGRNAKVLSDLSVLNDANFNNNLLEGEKFESAFVEFKDILISSINSFSANRYNIVLRDKNGNRVALGDRFMGGTSPKFIAGGRLVLPVIGARYASIKGIIYHAKRLPLGCSDDGGGVETFNEAGYQLHPFHPDHFVLDPNVPPIIEGIRVSPIVPSSSVSPVISADITSVQSTIAGAKLYYSVGDTANYKTIIMTPQGSTYSATIPNTEFADGKIVYYFVEATDRSTNPLTSFVPAVSLAGVGRSVEQPLGFVIRDNGLKIADVQYTPFKDGNSLYVGKTVTLTGIATASTKDLGTVVIQEEGAKEWGAIYLDNSAVLSNVKTGDKFTIAGTIEERSTSGAHRFTILKDIRSVGNENNVPIISSGNLVSPITVNPNLFSGFYDFVKHEKYEAMYVEAINPDGGKIFVVDTNADHTGNFAEYRISTAPVSSSLYSLTGNARNTSIPGLRVLVGRNTSSSAINSYNFSLITRPKGTNGSNPSNITVNGINVVYVSTSIFMDKLRGIMQHSFSNMKLLPRNNADAINPSVLLQQNPSTGINEQTSVSFSIVPNPNEGFFSINLPLGDSYLFEVLDILGSPILKGTSQGNTSVNLEGRTAGLYLVRVTNAQTKASSVQRLVVK